MENYCNKRRVKPTNCCQYGEKCFRKNPHHFMEYFHKHLDKIIEQNENQNDIKQYKIPDELLPQKTLILDQIKIINDLFPKQPKEEPIAKKNKSNEVNTMSMPSSSKSSNQIYNSTKVETLSKNDESTSKRNTVDIHQYIKVVAPKGRMKEKLDAAAPFNYFLTTITSSPPTHSEPLSITFLEILDPSLGDLECSVQINFMVELGWLLGQYHFAGCLQKPLLIIYGSGSPEFETISQIKPQVTAHLVKMPNPFSTHHTKAMLLGYTDGSMRVIISTANLYEDDWENRTQVNIYIYKYLYSVRSINIIDFIILFQ